MKLALALLALNLLVDQTFAEDCSSPAEVKFSCVHYSLFTNKSTPIIVDVPAASECEIAPYSGTIHIPESKKEKTIYSPKVIFKFLARDLEFAEITYKEKPDSEKEIELLCTDIKFIK